jgi:hypothetical protein
MQNRLVGYLNAIRKRDLWCFRHGEVLPAI